MPVRAEPGRRLWVAATGIAEVRAVLPLAHRLEALGHQLLLTVATADGLALARSLAAGIEVLPAPPDRASALRPLLDRWRADLVLLVDEELGRQRLRLLAERHIPAVVVSGRLGAATVRRWAGDPDRAGTLFGSLALVLAQSGADAANYRRLGAPRVEHGGSLKTAVEALPADTLELARLKAAIGTRRVWVAASLHPGEAPAVIAAHRRVVATHPDLLTVMVPRFPADATAMRAQCVAAGVTVDRRSEGARPASAVHLADTLGELGLWYRLGEVAFVGGSLTDDGGHNPVEPARLGCPVLLGPHLDDVEALAEPLLVAGVALRLADADDLASTLARLLDDVPALRRMAGRAVHASSAGSDVVASVLARLQPWLGAPTPAAEPTLTVS